MKISSLKKKKYQSNALHKFAIFFFTMNRRKSILVTSQETQFHLKQQEEELLHEIDQNVRTLALIHPLTDSAKNALVKASTIELE